jgi:hypothetical protein
MIGLNRIPHVLRQEDSHAASSRDGENQRFSYRARISGIMVTAEIKTRQRRIIE